MHWLNVEKSTFIESDRVSFTILRTSISQKLYVYAFNTQIPPICHLATKNNRQLDI